MSFHRVTLVALVTMFTVGMTSLASACCNWGYSAPVTYAQIAPAFGGCGGCGAPTAAVVFAQPVAPAPIVVSTPISTCGGCGGFSSWGGGCGNCGNFAWGGGGCGGCGGSGIFGGFGSSWGNGCGSCGQTVAYAEPTPYIVNQGPSYSGPGLTVPYATYSPEDSYAPAANYPYVPGYGNGQPRYPGYYARPYYAHRYGFHSPVYMNPRYYGGAGFYRGGFRGYGFRGYGFRGYGVRGYGFRGGYVRWHG
jgi:hypothetical protein